MGEATVAYLPDLWQNEWVKLHHSQLCSNAKCKELVTPGHWALLSITWMCFTATESSQGNASLCQKQCTEWSEILSRPSWFFSSDPGSCAPLPKSLDTSLTSATDLPLKLLTMAQCDFARAARLQLRLLRQTHDNKKSSFCQYHLSRSNLKHGSGRSWKLVTVLKRWEKGTYSRHILLYYFKKSVPSLPSPMD